MSAETTLPQIVGRAKSGDSGAISEIYDLYAVHILRFLYVRLNEQETAKDLTQEVFIRVIKGIRGLDYNGEQPFRGWLYTIAQNVLLAHLRRTQVSSVPFDSTGEIVDPHAQDGVFAIFDRVALAQAIRTLTADQQQVLTLRFFADMTNAEIAKQTHRSEGAVKALQYRALQHLQQVMSRDGEDPLMEAVSKVSRAKTARAKTPRSKHELPPVEQIAHGGLSLT